MRYFDGCLRGNLAQPFLRLRDSSFHALEHPVFIDGFLVAPVLSVPKMKYFRTHKTIFAPNSHMAEPQHQIGIFMTPPLKSFVKSVDVKKIPPPDTQIAAANALPLKTLLYPE